MCILAQKGRSLLRMFLFTARPRREMEYRGGESHLDPAEDTDTGLGFPAPTLLPVTPQTCVTSAQLRPCPGLCSSHWQWVVLPSAGAQFHLRGRPTWLVRGRWAAHRVQGAALPAPCSLGSLFVNAQNKETHSRCLLLCVIVFDTPASVHVSPHQSQVWRQGILTRVFFFFALWFFRFFFKFLILISPPWVKMSSFLPPHCLHGWWDKWVKSVSKGEKMPFSVSSAFLIFNRNIFRISTRETMFPIITQCQCTLTRNQHYFCILSPSIPVRVHPSHGRCQHVQSYQAWVCLPSSPPRANTSTLLKVGANFPTAPHRRVSALFLNNFGSVHRTILSTSQHPGENK